MYKIEKDLEEYIPFNEQEENDKKEILSLLKKDNTIFLRSNNQYHMTASAWVVNHDKTKVLMAYHNIYKSWSWLGGHADGEEDLLKVAIREVKEESGIEDVVCLDKNIFSIEILTVDGHMKKGKYVSSHLHLNITYLLEANETEMLSIKEDENSAVKWFSLQDAVEASTEEWLKERIYKKLNNKLTIYK